MDTLFSAALSSGFEFSRSAEMIGPYAARSRPGFGFIFVVTLYGLRIDKYGFAVIDFRLSDG